MDDVTKRLEEAAQTNHLVLILFYADCLPTMNGWNRLLMHMKRESSNL